MALALQIPCPSCGAPAGAPCRSANGRTQYAWYHRSRRDRSAADATATVSADDLAALDKVRELGGVLVQACVIGGYCWQVPGVPGSQIPRAVVERLRRAGLVEADGRQGRARLRAVGGT